MSFQLTDTTNLNLAVGWYIVLPSKKLDQKPLAVEIFGQKLLAWRNEQGRAFLMEEHCPHMGASLAGGKVANGCIECPFHKWQFDSTGKCVAIPGEEHIPQTARLNNYPNLLEAHGYLWAWYGTAEPLFALPPFPTPANQGYNFRSYSFAQTGNVPARRVLENIYDGLHLQTLHGLQASSTRFSFSENNAPYCFGGVFQATTQKYVGLVGLVSKALGLSFEQLSMHVESWTSGYSVALRLDGDLKWTALVSVTPVNANQTIMHTHIKTRQDGKMLVDAATYALFSAQAVASARQDVPVWNGIAGEGRVFVKDDKPVLQFRKFYQSWVDQVSTKSEKSPW